MEEVTKPDNHGQNDDGKVKHNAITETTELSTKEKDKETDNGISQKKKIFTTRKMAWDAIKKAHGHIDLCYF